MRETCEPCYTGATCLAHNKHSTAGSGDSDAELPGVLAKGTRRKHHRKHQLQRAPSGSSAMRQRFHQYTSPERPTGKHVKSLRPNSCKHPACSPRPCSDRSPPPDLVSPGRWQRPLPSGRARQDGGRSRSHAPAVTTPRAAARLHLLEVHLRQSRCKSPTPPSQLLGAPLAATSNAPPAPRPRPTDWLRPPPISATTGAPATAPRQPARLALAPGRARNGKLTKMKVCRPNRREAGRRQRMLLPETRRGCAPPL